MIKRTEANDLISYALTIDGETVSELQIDSTSRQVMNVETETEHRGNGYARQLWEAANAEAECFHALEHHRTEEGDAFAEAVGGETIDDEAGHIDVCGICTGALDFA